MFPRTERRARAGSLAAAAPLILYVCAVVICASRTRADGYDGIGFVLSLSQFDLTRFQPQPPGYPLFVALGRLLHRCGLSAGVSLALINAMLWGGGISALAATLERIAGRIAGRLCLALLTLAPLPFALGIATLSDGAGLGALLCAVALFTRPNRLAPIVGGIGLGLSLGLRPNYAPLALCILILFAIGRGLRSALRAALAALIATLAWLIPFACLVGPRTLWQTSRAHLIGHVQVYGESIATDSSPLSRLRELLRALGEATFGPLWPLLLPLLVVALWRFPKMRSEARRLLTYLATILAVYIAWVLIILPVHGRHLLPAVAILACAVAVVLGEAAHAFRDRRVLRALSLCGIGLLTILGASTARAIWLLRQPSPGMALADHVAAHHPRGTLLYGATAARQLDLRWGSGSAHQTLYFGDVIVEAERMNRLPDVVLLTSEVRATPERRIESLARFCYDARLPLPLRFEKYPGGCVELRSYRFRP